MNLSRAPAEPLLGNTQRFSCLNASVAQPVHDQKQLEPTPQGTVGRDARSSRPANGRDVRRFGGALRRGDGWLMPPIPLDRLGPLGTLGAGVDLAHVHPFAAMLGARRASRALRSSTGVRRTGQPTSHSRLSTPTGRWAKMSAFVACDRSSDRHRRQQCPDRSREHHRQTHQTDRTRLTGIDVTIKPVSCSQRRPTRGVNTLTRQGIAPNYE